MNNKKIIKYASIFTYLYTNPVFHKLCMTNTCLFKFLKVGQCHGVQFRNHTIRWQLMSNSTNVSHTIFAQALTVSEP